MKKELTYKINEIFETLQGEGSFTGQPSIFIRLQGCPVGCSWCDTKHTWLVSPEQEVERKNIVAKKVENENWGVFTIEQLKALFLSEGYQAKHIVITGGEPCMYDLSPLCIELEAVGYSCQVETSGTFEIQVSEKCWVTVSPKVNMKGGYKVLKSALLRANEIKHPVATEQHIDDLKALLIEHAIVNKQIYIQPISQKKRATELAIRSCIENNWRLSVQMHKYIGIE
ncbi:pyrroloquinoline quinone biosynthesis protein [Colwellia sp. MT41]|uniref:7-carboxy-7-deazaguanine synthase QueE n=1 Tax=Colwellia sp. MT41 TaxID=58049 RepID=UPI000717A719|nr:7-carboxy-7-deazaguanine synthase QueE [Colwellia sp. MT41]ALO34568.1 pyrroloquinoline quinone biosynthesis protein [Colwellia sp. MT41]